MNWNPDEKKPDAIEPTANTTTPGATGEPKPTEPMATSSTAADGSASGDTTSDGAPAANTGITPAAPVEERRPRRRGFAAMDRDRVKEIASKGGKAAHAAGTAHQFSSDEARVAGKKGGQAPHVRRGGVRRRPNDTGIDTSGQGDSSSDGR